MNSHRRHVLGVWLVGELRRLHEEEQKSLPEFNSRHRGKTHEQKDSQQNRERDLLDGVEEQERKPDQQVGEEVRQSRLLHLDDIPVLVLLGQVI